MSIAIVEQTQVGYIAEVTPGTTPATPAFKLARIKSESLTAERKYVYSSELNGLRGQKNAALAESHGSGGLDFEFTYGSFDDFLEAALRSTWATNVLTDANVVKSFTLETKFEDGATDIYKRLVGAQVNTFSLAMKPGDIVTGNVSFLALQGDYANAAIASSTYAAGNTEPVNVGANVGSISLTGLTFDSMVSMNLNISNNLRLQDSLNGSVNPFAIAAGLIEVTGSFGIYVDSTAYNVIRAACDGTPTGVSFQVGTGAGKRTKFEALNCILEQPKSDASSIGSDMIASFNFRALQSTTLSGSVIRVTRNL